MWGAVGEGLKVGDSVTFKVCEADDAGDVLNAFDLEVAAEGAAAAGAKTAPAATDVDGGGGGGGAGAGAEALQLAGV